MMRFRGAQTPGRKLRKDQQALTELTYAFFSQRPSNRDFRFGSISVASYASPALDTTICRLCRRQARSHGSDRSFLRSDPPRTRIEPEKTTCANESAGR